MTNDFFLKTGQYTTTVLTLCWTVVSLVGRILTSHYAVFIWWHKVWK